MSVWWPDFPTDCLTVWLYLYHIPTNSLKKSNCTNSQLATLCSYKLICLTVFDWQNWLIDCLSNCLSHCIFDCFCLSVGIPECMCVWLSVLSVWLTLSDRLTDRLSDWLSNYLTGCLAVWVTVSLSNWLLAFCLAFWPSNSLSSWMSVCLTSSLSTCLANYLTVCLSLCFMVCLCAPLSDCLSDWMSDCQTANYFQWPFY